MSLRQKARVHFTTKAGKVKTNPPKSRKTKEIRQERKKPADKVFMYVHWM